MDKKYLKMDLIDVIEKLKTNDHINLIIQFI